MIGRLLTLILAILVLGAGPASAAPEVRATMAHVCCDHCVNAVKSGVVSVPWVAAACVNAVKDALARVAWIGTVDARPNAPVRISSVNGAPIRLMELVSAIRQAGFAAHEIILVGP